MLSDNNNWQALILPFLYLGDISLQVRARLRKSSKVILICCKVQIVFKSKWKHANVFLVCYINVHVEDTIFLIMAGLIGI